MIFTSTSVRPLDTTSHNIFVGKVTTYGLDKCAVRSLENWLQRVVIRGTKSSWSLVLRARGQYRGQNCLPSLLMTWMMSESAPSTSTQEIQNGKEWLIDQMVALLSREIQTGWKAGQTGILYLTRENENSCIGCPGGQLADYEPAMHPYGKETNNYCRLH